MLYPSSLLALFAPRVGRVTQSEYILGFILPLGAVTGLTWLLLAGSLGFLGTPAHVIVILGWTVLLATGDAYNIRRWHDLGSSGVFYRLLRPCLVLLPVIALLLQFIAPAHLAMTGDMAALSFMMGMEFGGVAWQPAPLALLAITVLAGAGNVIYLAVTPGQQGDNLYGPDPHGAPLMPVGRKSGRIMAESEGDPVKRALADYQARHQQSARPAQPQPGGKTAASTPFGKKR